MFLTCESHSVPAVSQLVLTQPQSDWRLYEYVLAAYLFAPVDKSQLCYVESQWQVDENVCTPHWVMVTQSRQSDVPAFVPALMRTVNLSATPLLSFSSVEVKGQPADRWWWWWCPFSCCDYIRLWYECWLKHDGTGEISYYWQPAKVPPQLLLSLVSISA